MSLAHPIEGDYLGRGYGDCDVPGSYARRWQDINRTYVGAVTACKYHDVVARYGDGTDGAQAHMV